MTTLKYNISFIVITLVTMFVGRTMLYGSLPGTSENKNYIITYTPRIASDNISEVPDVSKGAVIKYYDGLGRKTQQVSYLQSPDQGNIVQPIVYDEFGRRSLNYLPYEDSESDDASYYSNWQNEQRSFYNELYDTDERDYGFTKTFFENSPLNRVKAKMGPGRNWHEAEPDGKKTEYTYGANKASDNIKKFNTDNTGQLIPAGNFATGNLYKYKQTDEDEREYTEWKDFRGRVIQTDQGKDALIASTMYVYDDFGMLRWVLPPKVAKMDDLNLTPGEGIAKDLCYYYKYDERKRLIEKHLPGADPVYFVYDKRDRMVMSQDGNQRYKSEWTIHKYDNFDRMEYSAIINSDDSRENLQEDFNNANLEAGEPYKQLVNGEDIFFENIWDNYDNASVWPDWKFQAKNVWQDYPQTHTDITQSLLTASREKIINNNGSFGNWLYSKYFYDEKGRLIQSYRQTDDAGSFLHTFYLINWNGDIEKEEVNLSFYLNRRSSPEESTLLYEHTYDHTGRLIYSDITFIKDILTASYSATLTYDQLGRIKQELLNNDISSNYNYNIRSWITSIEHDISEDNIFEMELQYETANNNPQYAGNIAAITWNSEEFYQPKTYEYKYDELNRLINADYSPNDHYSTSYQYDIQGNLLELTRNGYFGRNSYGIMDDLRYQYYKNNKSNYLKSVRTEADSNIGFNSRGLYENTLPDYYYDQNGNMKKDIRSNREISYNFLNLPSQIKNDKVQVIYYQYTASGEKIRQTLYDDGKKGAERRYNGPFVYVNDQLAWVNIPNGRMINLRQWTPEFHLKDHLGNTRITLHGISGSYITTQSNHYYPFGMMVEELSYQGITGDNRYLYNSKELQDDFELNWYDYGARFYDAEIGRWHVVDAMAEYYYSHSPYNYVGNNPISYIDPDGNFRTRFGAWLHKLWNGGDGIGRDVGGEHFVYTDNSYTDDDGVFTVASTRVFDKDGRSQGKKRYDQAYGAPVWGVGGFEPKTEAENVGPGIDPGLLAGRGPAGRYSSPGGTGISIAFLISRITGIFKTTKESDRSKDKTSQTELSETGVKPPDKTDARGKPLDSIAWPYVRASGDTTYFMGTREEYIKRKSLNEISKDDFNNLDWKPWRATKTK